MYNFRSLTAVLVAIAVAGPISAQESAPDPLAEETEHYNRERRRLIVDNLQLTASEAGGFWPIYEQFEKEGIVLREKRRQLIAEFGENYDQMTDAMARKLLTDRLDLEEERARIWKIYFAKFEKVLPIKKLARFYQIESKIRAFVDAGIAEKIPLIQ